MLQKRLHKVAEQRLHATGITPGGTVAVGRGDKLLACAAFGATGSSEAVSASETRYDVASVSKLFTTAAILMLAQDNRLGLDQPVGDFLPEYTSGAKAKVTFRMLLQHRSGLHDPKYRTVTRQAKGPEEVWQRVLSTPLRNIPGKRFSYSNFGFATAWAAASRAAGEPLEQFLQRELFTPLSMTNTGYAPDVTHCAPTSPDDNQAKVLTCVPQDELARGLGNASGHAGLFSTAVDLGRFEAMLASEGSLGGHRYLTSEHVQLMRTPQPNTRYGLGARTNNQGTAGKEMSRAAWGHTGYTGASAFTDPANGVWVVMLTNGTLHRGAPGAGAYKGMRAINNTAVTMLKS